MRPGETCSDLFGLAEGTVGAGDGAGGIVAAVLRSKALSEASVSRRAA